MIGRTLAHYEITGSLGSGGMGEVWRAHDTKLGREVAIKTLARDLAEDTERLARFEREAKLLAALNHAHIAAIYGLDEHDGTTFLVMELVEGETLEERLKAGPLPVEHALELALQIAEALEAAHEKGVVHRDLKPANIMITPEGNVKVLDFGLAKAFAGDPNDARPAHSPALSLAATQQGLVLGTAGYMSPEQASGQATDKRADVWSFGVVLYEMLTGMPLFTGESVPHILAGVLRSDPDWSRLPAGLHPRLTMLLERCLDKKLRNRYHDIADARVDIEKVLADPDGAVREPSAGAVAGSRLPLLAATAALAAVIAGAGAWVLKPAPAPRAEPVARFDFALGEGQLLRAPGRDVIAVSPDGTRIVYNTTDGLYLRAIGEPEGRLIPGTEALMANPFFSPDGEWIGFYDGQLKKMRTTGGAAVVLAEAENPRGAYWSRDGTTIVFGQTGGIMRVSANGGTPSLLVPVSGQEQLWDPQLLPNGNVLYTRFSAGPQSGEILVWSRDAGESTVLFPGERAVYTPTGHLIVSDPGVPNTLFARTFDLDTLEAGGPVPVVESVQVLADKTHYAIASSGTLVYVHGQADPSAAAGAEPDLHLTIIDREGNRRILDAPPRAYRSPRLSPDGTQVAVEILDDDQRSSIWIYDLGGETDIRRLTQVNEGNNLRPVWTPDGERITFMSDRDGPGSIYWQPADGSAPAERLTTAAEGTIHLPESWSPDGVLSFALIEGGFTAASWGIWTRNADGEIEVFHSLDPGNQFGSAFSPDGKWLAYSSGETSPTPEEVRIYVERFPKTGERHEIADDAATWPVWSRDGTELFYRRGLTPQTRLLNSVSILQTEPRFRFTTSDSVAIRGFTTYTNYRDFDPLPDGSGWLMLTTPNEAATGPATPAEPPRINVVLNWFAELDARVPTR